MGNTPKSAAKSASKSTSKSTSRGRGGSQTSANVDSADDEAQPSDAVALADGESDADESAGKSDTPTNAAATDKAPRRRFGGRSAAALLCGGLAVLLGVLGLAGSWVMNTAANTGWVEDQVVETLKDPEVSNELAATLVTEFGNATNIEERLGELIPTQLDKATPIIISAAQTQLTNRVAQLIRSDEFTRIIARAVGTAQEGAINVLSGSGDGIQGVNVDNGEVRVNLVPLIPIVIQAAQELGLFQNVTVPQIDTRRQTPAEQVAAVNAALNLQLGDSFAQPVVFRSAAVESLGSTLNTVRAVLLWARRLVWLLLLAAIGFAVAAVRLSRSRSRGALWMAGAFALSLTLVRVVVGMIVGRVSSLVAQPASAAAVQQVTGNAVSTLTRWFVVVVIITGAAAGAAYWLAREKPAPAQ